MKILIITAMEEELIPLVKTYSVKKINEKFINPLYIAEIKKHKLLFTWTGVGVVNAAFATSALIHEFKPNLIINLGTAGGVDANIEILDVIIADKLSYFDVDVTTFGYKKGQIPNQEVYHNVELDKTLIKNINNSGIKTHIGTIISGNKFIDNKQELLGLIKEFKNVYAVDMESAAIVDIANKLNTDVLIIRGISDLAHENSAMEFDEFLPKVMDNFIKIINIIVDTFD